MFSSISVFATIVDNVQCCIALLWLDAILASLLPASLIFLNPMSRGLTLTKVSVCSGTVGWDKLHTFVDDGDNSVKSGEAPTLDGVEIFDSNILRDIDDMPLADDAFSIGNST